MLLSTDTTGAQTPMFRLPTIRSRQRSRGQGVVEFALILPVLVFLLLVTLDFGRLFMSYVTLTNTTRVAANFGATDPGAFTGTPDTTTYDAVVGRESVGLNCALKADSGGYNPPIPTYPSGTGLSGRSVASMSCDFSPLTPFITNFFGGPLAISASADFPIRTGAITNIGSSTTVPPPGSPQADFNFAPGGGGTIDGAGNISGDSPLTVTVIDASAYAQTWDWDWGDGSVHDFTPNPAAHQYTSASVYTVRLTITNTIGTSTRSRAVTVTAPPAPVPVAGFYGTPVANPPRYTAGGGSGGAAISGSLPLVVDFTNLTTNGTAYSWDFGDGTAPSTAAGPQHQYTKLGVFTVTLTVTAPPGGSPYTRVSYVTTGCVVPNFANTSTSNAESAYVAANFPSGSITYHAVGATGKGSKNAPSGKNIVSQSPFPGGTFVAATKQGNSWSCDANITLEYTP